MSKYSKESLEKLLTLIDSISANPDYEWFREELVKRCNIDFSHLAFIRKEYKKKGSAFYSSITDAKLKKQLVQDHTEMMYYLLINNPGRFLLYINLQIENLLNAFCQINNVHQFIEYSEEKVLVKIKNTGKDWIIDCDRRFYDMNNQPKDIKLVDLWAKIGFWIFRTNNQLYAEKRYFIFHNIINARNVYSHRHALETDNYGLQKTKEMVAYLKDNAITQSTFYLGILQEIKKAL